MIEITFLTSNLAKLAHAQYLGQSYDISIIKLKWYGRPYNEPRIQERNQLLKLSIEDAIRRWKSVVSNPDRVFFIEDTSVRIDALSTIKEEVPGVDIKYWMRETNFNTLNERLKSRGNNRKVTVRSDIILFLPKYLQDRYGTEYKIFTSQTEGTIVENEIEIKTQELYPWLSGRTFNKWFVPNGADKPLSALPIKIADIYDFRAGAFSQMLELLKSNKLIQKKLSHPQEGKQISFLNSPLFIICGPTCAGKSTLAEYLSSNYNYFSIEASDFMWLSYYELHGTNSTVKISDFAKQALIENPSIVVDQIIKHIDKINNIPLVITGFRSPEEVASFKKQYRGLLKIKQVYITAEQKLRFERSIFRNRKDSESTFEDFKSNDEKQNSMGLSIIQKLFENDVISNNGTLSNFFDSFVKDHLTKDGLFDSIKPVTKTKKSKLGLEEIILITLLMQENQDKYFTTTEIAHLINIVPSKLTRHKDNISRYFNQNFYPYYEISVVDEKRFYRLSQTGRAKAKWLHNKYFTMLYPV